MMYRIAVFEAMEAHQVQWIVDLERLVANPVLPQRRHREPGGPEDGGEHGVADGRVCGVHRGPPVDEQMRVARDRPTAVAFTDPCGGAAVGEFVQVDEVPFPGMALTALSGPTFPASGGSMSSWLGVGFRLDAAPASGLAWPQPTTVGDLLHRFSQHAPGHD
ncbi:MULTISPECIES: hypothetical protein [unclassified Streptomyces]|uniref:hypothetical protein n=1 Tax=Streptomyces TaxID=1883 RepID=UPI0013E32BA3|nr:MULTISPECIES: hypothetical protein [unclassified Streptomyces]UQA32358.1 hypothetical protein KRR37_00260 [Streptomyces sp. HNA39]